MMNYNYKYFFESQAELEKFEELLNKIKQEVSMSKLIELNKLTLKIYSEGCETQDDEELVTSDRIFDVIDDIANDCGVGITEITYSFDSEEELKEQCENHYGWITVHYYREIRREDLDTIDAEATERIINERSYLDTNSKYLFEFSDQIDVPVNELEYRVSFESNYLTDSRKQDLLVKLCKILNRNDDISIQIDNFEADNEIEFLTMVLNTMKESDEAQS